METLINRIRKEEEKRFAEYANSFYNLEHRDSIIRRDAPKLKKYEQLTTDEEKINFILEIERKAMEKRISKGVEKLKRIYATEREIVEISISVEWKRNAIWGSNPRATVNVYFSDNSKNIYESGSIGGSGYDKESAAVAKALNQCDELIKLCCIAVSFYGENVKNSEILGYGSGYGVIPYFEGGVGVSCYYKIFEVIGYKMNKVASGKTFDVYNVTKQSK